MLNAGDRPRPQEEPRLRIWAAASLGPVLDRAALAWEASGHPRPVITTDATSRMAAQVAQGAPADLLFTADARWMTWALDQGTVVRESVRTLAGNRLVLATGAAFPPPPLPGDGELGSALRSLPSNTRVGIAGESVPAGRFARQTLAALGVDADLDDALVVGANVRTVVEWLARGEVQLGFVYASDALDPRLAVVREVPDGLHDPARVLAGVAVGSPVPEVARDFLSFLEAGTGAGLFREAGFAPPLTELAGPPEPAATGAGTAAVQPGSTPSISSAIGLSIRVALVSTLLSALPAIALGWVLARRSFPGKSVLSAVLLTPLVIPPVVTGFLLLSLLGAQSPVGQALASVGLPVPFTFLAAVLAAAVVGFPLFVISVRNAFETVDPRYEEMSWTLGGRPRQTFWRISLPLAAPGIGAGAVLSFARALGEFGATVVLAGNLEGETRTIALAVYTLLEAPSGREAIWVLVGASVGISLLALAGFEILSRRQQERIRRSPGV